MNNSDFLKFVISVRGVHGYGSPGAPKNLAMATAFTPPSQTKPPASKRAFTETSYKNHASNV